MPRGKADDGFRKGSTHPTHNTLTPSRRSKKLLHANHLPRRRRLLHPVENLSIGFGVDIDRGLIKQCIPRLSTQANMAVGALSLIHIFDMDSEVRIVNTYMHRRATAPIENPFALTKAPKLVFLPVIWTVTVSKHSRVAQNRTNRYLHIGSKGILGDRGL